MTTDALTRQVIQSYMNSTVREMMRTAKTSAYSVILAEGEDFTCGITDPDGKLTFQAEGLGLHAASFPDAVRLVLDYYDSIEPGDIFFHNDPYKGGAHQADGAFVRPVFWEDELVCFVATRGHWADIGGMSAGGWAGSAEHVIQEALLVPPIKLFKRGVVDDELRRFLLSNIRNPTAAWGTIQAQIACLLKADERIHEVVEKHGLSALHEATQSYLYYARRRFVAGLEPIPDGEWSAEIQLDDDGTGAGPFTIRARVVKKGESVQIDFDGTDPQARGPANTALTNTRSGALVALLSVIDPDLPLNSGWFDLVDIKAPVGSLVNPVYPAPMFHGTGAPIAGVFEVVVRALAQAVPDRVSAGSYGSGTAFILYFRDDETEVESSWMNYIGGGNGGRARRDGESGLWWTLANCKLESVEVIENRYPFVVERQAWVEASGGAGRQRGGLGIERELRLLEPATAASLNDRHKTPPWGFAGGGEGACSRQLLRRGGVEGTFEELAGTRSPSKFANVPLRVGDVVTLASGGGGGYGDPFERSPEAVREDVEQGYISARDALLDYGVTIGEDGTVDEGATLQRRQSRVR